MPHGFEIYSDYFGLLADDVDPGFPTRLYGFERKSEGNRTRGDRFEFPDDGALYGYVAAGKVELRETRHPSVVTLGAGEWFVLPGKDRPAELRLSEDGSCFVAQRIGFRAQRAFGGPIEAAGRLRYIDGCTDSVLAAPSRLGDPCLNHLHFPPGIDQTMHVHPSVRCGTVARGHGWCETPDGRFPLEEGLLWVIRPQQRHKFVTEPSQSMDVVPYHPESDFGPTDEVHPMLNKTLGEGGKIDNRGPEHDPVTIVDGWA